MREKKDGSFSRILNLKKLNKHVEYLHFKMDSVWTAIRLMTPNCYMASIDLKDAYYSVPILPSHQKYLKFQWNNVLYQYTCFPNGLALCPKKFTKLMKRVYATLRQLGHISSAYIDDSWLMGIDWYTCARSVIDTAKVRVCCSPSEIGPCANPATCVFGFYFGFCTYGSEKACILKEAATHLLSLTPAL